MRLPMKSICQRLGISLLIALFCLPAVAEEFSRLEDEMSTEDFEKSGLKQLSKKELEHLNAWLRRNLELADLPPEAQVTSIVAPPEPAPAPAPASTQADPRTTKEEAAGFENQRERSRQKFTSRLVGSFSGWSGKTTFKLENGQVWRQARSGSYRHRTLTNPAVTLVPKALNTWSLEIEGLNRSVRVKRIK